MTAHPVLETVTFRLHPGTDTAAFLAAAQGTEAPLRQCAGFLSRSLCLGENGDWADHVVWADGAAAQAAAEAMMAHPAFGAFMALIDGASVDMRHAPILWQMD